MSLLADIRRRLGGVFVTRRLALLVFAAAPVVVFLPGVWAWVAAFGWIAFCAVLARRDVHGAPGAGDLSVERTVPSKFSIGVANRTTLTVQNSSALRARIVGRETPPAGFAGSRGIGPLVLEPRGDAEIELRFVPPARGAYRFGKVGLRSHGPRGLAGRQFDAGTEQDVRVYPDLSAVHGYSLLARRGSLHEIGVRAARYAGVGTDFESLREYIDGDDYRDIDWKATARRGSPVVRTFEAERSQTMVLAVDAGRLMTARVGGMAKLDRAINAALLLAYLATRSGDNVGLLVFGRDIQRYVPPRKGHRQFLAILEALYPIEGRVEEPDYAGALRYLATRLSKRSLVVVFTELVGTEPSRRLLGVLGSLTPRHLPLVITQRNLETEAVAVSMPADESAVYRSVVAQDVLHDKAAALRLLAARGSLVLDVVPERLSVAAVNRYLEIKARGRL